jgi:Tol biopolymer transport system component
MSGLHAADANDIAPGGDTMERSSRTGQRLRRGVVTLVIAVALTASLGAAGAATTEPVLPSGKIAFASDREWGTVPSTQVFAVNADGSGLDQLTNFPWWAETPSWSPNGTHIAITGIRPEAAFMDGNASADHARRIGHSHGIYVMNADGSHVVRLISGDGQPVLPAWSPDGTSIAFIEWAPGCPVFPSCLARHVMLMNADGSGIRQVTSGPNFDFRPTWSPDGSKLAFERDSDVFSHTAIYTVNRDGTGLSKVVNVACCPDPAWSTDGTKIAFWNGELPGLQVVNVATKVVTTVAVASRLGGGQTDERWASWSPDGRWLAVGSCCETSDGVDLYLVSANGAVTRPVPNAEGASGPAWQPDS